MANIVDYGIGTVLTAPSPATSGTTIVLNSGQGAIMPTNVPFKITAVPMGVIPTLSNCEKLLVTARSGDALTVTRAQSPTTAKSIATGWIIMNSVFTEDQFNASMTMGEILGGTPNGVLTAFTTSTNFTIIAVYKNGVRMTQGVGKDYVVTNSTTVTFSTPPTVSTVLTADYMVGALININNSNSLIQKEAVTGTINGSNAVFTTLRPYIGSSLEVYVNGLAQGNTYVTETSPSVGTFTLDVAPLTGDIIHVSYQSSTGVYANADTVDNYHANATPTANTIPVLDSTAKLPVAINGVKIGSIAGSVFGTTGNKSVTGLGFTPKLVKFTYMPSGTGASQTCIGAMTSTSQYYASMNADSGTGRARNSGTDAVIGVGVASTGVLYIKVAYVSMDSDGFTLNVITADSTFPVAYEAYA